MSKFILKRKIFSLEEGRFTGKRITTGQTFLRQEAILGTLGATAGAALGSRGSSLKGAGIGLATGTILTLISTALIRSSFNKKSTPNITTIKLISEFSKVKEKIEKLRSLGHDFGYNLESYDIDKDPIKFDVSIKSNEDSATLFVRNMNKLEMESMNTLLDRYCYVRKNNDYEAEQQKDGSWIITLKLVDYKEVARFLIDLMNKLKFRINFLTK